MISPERDRGSLTVRNSLTDSKLVNKHKTPLHILIDISGLAIHASLQVAPTAGALSLLGSQDVYTTHISPVGYLPRDVASLRVRYEQLTRRDFHPLDCSLAGCSQNLWVEMMLSRFARS